MTQQIFRRHSNIYRNDSVPRRNTVLLWVTHFRETASAAKIKRPGRQPSLRTPENIERLRQAFVRSPPLAGMCWQQGTPPNRHYIQEMNIIIKMLWDQDNFSNKFTLKGGILFILLQFKNRQVFLPDPVYLVTLKITRRLYVPNCQDSNVPRSAAAVDVSASFVLIALPVTVYGIYILIRIHIL